MPRARALGGGGGDPNWHLHPSIQAGCGGGGPSFELKREILERGTIDMGEGCCCFGGGGVRPMHQKEKNRIAMGSYGHPHGFAFLSFFSGVLMLAIPFVSCNKRCDGMLTGRNYGRPNCVSDSVYLTPKSVTNCTSGGPGDDAGDQLMACSKLKCACACAFLAFFGSVALTCKSMAANAKMHNDAEASNANTPIAEILGRAGRQYQRGASLARLSLANGFFYFVAWV